MSELSHLCGSEGYGACGDAQMQTFVTQTEDKGVEGFDGYNGDLTGDVAATLGVNCGMSTGRNGVIAFAANQRDEVRDLHDIAGALQAQPMGPPARTQRSGSCGERSRSEMSELSHSCGSEGYGACGDAKQQTFVAGFCAEASKNARGIGYQDERSPTLKAVDKGPSVLCLNDQGGKVMACSEDVAGTLRAQEHGHQPLVFENHGIDARYTGPHDVAPTVTSRYGTGGNNVPLVEQDAEVICIAGNIIDRQPQNGGNGFGYQADLSYTLTATDRHALFSLQRSDEFKDSEVASTESARQYKDHTDLVYEPHIFGQADFGNYQDGVATLRASGGDHGGGSENLAITMQEDEILLIRRLVPLECERLQGFPDGWTDIPGASDSARYKALGNSVAIPCVQFIMQGIRYVADHPKGTETA